MSGEIHCWACSAKNTETAGMTGPMDAAPREGDVSVCLYCRAISVFTGDGKRRRPPTVDELAEFEQDERIPAVMRVATRVHLATRSSS